MPDPILLKRLVERVTQQIRLRRAEFYGLRGLFVGSLLALVPILVRDSLGGSAGLWLAGGIFVLGGVAGALAGMWLRLPAGDAARLTDRGYELQDRVATALEWADRPDRTPLVDALVTDTISRVQRLDGRRIIPRLFPREAKFIPVPLVLAIALAVAPPIPLPISGLPNFSASTEDGEDELEERTGKLEIDERPRATKTEPIQRADLQERTVTPRHGGGGQNQPGDLAAIFKDTSLGSRSPDFSSFLKKGDERIRMLEQVDRLPDLQRDFTQSQHKMVFQRSKALKGGLRPDQVSPEKLRELLNEMERLGRKGGGGWGGDVSDGMEALDQGQTDRAMEAMERALSKMRSLEEGGRDGKGLRGGRESDRRGGQRGDRSSGRGGPGDEGDFPEGEGMAPGRGKSGSPKGDPTQRLRADPYDVGVEGEARSGKKEGFDTNMLGRGANTPSRLQYLGVMGQYRKMMEEAIAREQVPRDFQSQVKEYFQALEER